MAEQEQQTSPEQSTSTEAETATQSLDDVYKQYNVEEAAQEFKPQPQAQPAPQPVAQPAPSGDAIPDAVLDPQGHKAWIAQNAATQNNALRAIAGELVQYRTEKAKAAEEADIKSAVTQFKEKLGEDIDDDMAEVALGQKARKDPRFLAVYQNRQKNPAAWKAAVGAYANEFKGKVQFKIDPQIAENQRAAKQSVSGSQSTRNQEPQGDEARFAGKTGREFEAEWERYKSQGVY